jgi:acetyl-CoA synthetase
MADIYPVDPQFAAKARIDKTSYEQQYQASVTDPDGFWGKAAERLQWMRKPTKIKNVSYDLSDFHIKWFEDGELNASVNCLDRQLETRGDKTALLFEPDGPDAPAARHLSRAVRAHLPPRQRAAQPRRQEGRPSPSADDRRRRGGHAGLRRIGAIHSVVFGGFSPNRSPTASATARAS